MVEHGPASYRILLVEDNGADAYLLRKALEKAGLTFDLIVIEDGAQALDFVRSEGKYAGREVPHLAVLDLNLPKNEGSEVLAALRQVPDVARVPVVITSSSSLPYDRTSAEQFGVERYIVKPTDLEASSANRPGGEGSPVEVLRAARERLSRAVVARIHACSNLIVTIMSDLSGIPHQLDPKKRVCRAIIETPKGFRNKFDYDPDANLFKLGGLLPEGMMFPFDFGFIPSTLGDDGDPVDIMVLMDAPAHVGCLVDVRIIGIIEAKQTEDGKTETNNRTAGSDRPFLHKRGSAIHR